MSINVLNEHKAINGNRTTTITYCIDTGELIDANQVVRSRGGDLTVPNDLQRSKSSSFKRLFHRSSFNKNTNSKTNNNNNNNKNHQNGDSIRRYSIDDLNNCANDNKLSRTRSLKSQNTNTASATINNNNNNKLIIKTQQPVKRSKSEHGQHAGHSPSSYSKYFLTQNNNNEPNNNNNNNNNNYLIPNIINSNNIINENTDKNNSNITSKRQSFIKRLSTKLRKSTKSNKKNEQVVQQQTATNTQSINLNIEIMKSVFEFFDYGKKGYITVDDVEIAIKKLEKLKNEIEFPNRDKINESFLKYSKNGKFELKFEEFLEIMKNVEAERISENENDEIKYLFKQFDRNNDGKITKDELKLVMCALFPGDEINDYDIERMLDEADLDQNGSIDYNEFVSLFTLFSSQFTIEKSITRELVDRSIRNCGLIISMNNKQMQTIDLKQAFSMFDKNGDNKISPVELEEVMKYLGLNPSADEVKKMIKVVDKNSNGHVDYEEFISMMTQTKLRPRSQEDELKEIFQVFDIDGNGYISADEIKTKMAQLGDNLSDDEVKEMIKSADTNGDGLIDINEFSKLLQYAKEMK